MDTQTKTKDHIIIAALSLAGQMGWDMVTLNDIAAEANVDLADIHTHFADKADIVHGFGRMIDAQVLKTSQSDPASDVREMFFDIMMDRFEALNVYREGVLSILDSYKTDPKQLLFSAPALCRSMGWMLEACNISTNGYKGAARVAGASALAVKLTHTWTKDDTPDMAKVMADLDKHLNRLAMGAERLGL